jgi:hypothetical protein
LSFSYCFSFLTFALLLGMCASLPRDVFPPETDAKPVFSPRRSRL